MVYCRKCGFYHNGRQAKSDCMHRHYCKHCNGGCEAPWPLPFLNSHEIIPKAKKDKKFTKVNRSAIKKE